jgi:glutamine amidotransferase
VIGIIDYGVTNLGSMQNMLRRLGCRAEVIRTPGAVHAATKLILPGIGHFDHGVAALDERKLIDPIRAQAMNGIPLLGVCLGMQLLGEGSEEGRADGLGLIHASSRRFRFPSGHSRRIPHMGWNKLTPQREDPVIGALAPTARFYFVHSYHVECRDEADSIATATYGYPFTAAVRHRNIWGVQFHPEKSLRYGMQLLQNFLAV